MEVNSATVIKAVKSMKKKDRQLFLEDLIAATSPEYLRSIREARRDHKAGRVKSHAEVFGR
jgi:hypothetical protein